MRLRKLLSIILSKFIKDELTSAALYVRLAQIVRNPNIQKELLEHATEEFGHYKQLMTFAANRGIPVVVQIDDKLVNTTQVSTTLDILTLVQNLEKIAAKDYARLARISLKIKDIEMFDLFKQLMKDELEHFDDLNVFIGETREV